VIVRQSTVILLGALGLLALSRSARAAQDNAPLTTGDFARLDRLPPESDVYPGTGDFSRMDREAGEPEIPPELAPSGTDAAASGDFDAHQFDGVPTMPAQFQPTGDPAANLAAFLYLIRSSEHLFPRDVVGDAAYQIFYGGSRFESMADHPTITGEKRGIRLPAQMCRNAGYASGVCVSTAAGAYQINRPTWDEFRAAGRWGPRLPDFSPASQDEAARRILARVGALPLIEAGDIEGAIVRASPRWASLPFSTSGQRKHSLEFAAARFNEAAQAA